jgi:hypothetical protein
MVPNIRTRLNSLTPKQKKWIGAGVVALIIAGSGWNLLLGKASAIAQDKILAQANESINGKITVGRMDVSFLGTIHANQVAIYDERGNLMGKTAKVKVDFSLSDLLAGKVDLQALKSVTVENPDIIVSQQDGKWNWEGLLKPKPEEPFTFRGQIVVKDGSLSLDSPENRKLEAIEGKVNFAGYPSFAVDFTSKKGSVPLSVKGAWSFSGDGAMDIKAEKAPLTDLPLDVLAQADVKINGGSIDSLVLHVAKQTGGYTFGGEGTISDMAATAAGYNISQGLGKFKFENNSLTIQSASLQLNGQTLSVDGAVTISDNIALNLNIAATAFDLSVLAGPSFQGPITFQANIQGTPSTPQAQGQFSIPHGAVGALTFSAASGNFTYSGGSLTLNNTQATTWDGTLFVNGTVLPVSQQYNLAVTGSGIDSALLTDKDIHGRVGFNAAVSGQGSSGMAASGSFSMGEGEFCGVPFISMTGDFTKQGEQMNFSNIVVRTIAGAFAASGFSEGSVIKLQKSDALINNSIPNVNDTINNTINNTITNELKKLRL